MVRPVGRPHARDTILPVALTERRTNCWGQAIDAMIKFEPEEIGGSNDAGKYFAGYSVSEEG